MRTCVLRGVASACCVLSVALAAQPAPFQIEETTIAKVHAAMRAHQLTCHQLVDAYLQRIAKYDKNEPPINAIVLTNPNALKEADELDRRFASGGLTGPLHCVPTIVKDNYETIGLQSADGSLSLKGFVSDKDAFLVKRIKAAGAIVLAKSNMAEFAFSPNETVNSLLGTTRNPYDLTRVPAGSSGGTAAAVAANFGLVGLGSDTGNSIRGPSSHNALVGIRSTMGLTSRAGVIPLSYLADIAGPMTRTVEDATAVFQVIVGEDPEDPMTARSRGHKIPKYADALKKDGLKGARIGVLHQAWERPPNPNNPNVASAVQIDDEVAKVFAQALADIKTAGATIVDDAKVELPARTGGGGGGCRGFKYDLDDYLATRGQKAPVHSLAEILASPAVASFPPSVAQRARQAAQRHAERPGQRRVQGRRRVPRGVRRGRHEDDGHAEADRVRLSDVELSAASARVGDDASGRQQPAVLADVRLPRHQRADGLHAQRHAPGRHDDLRTGVGRSDTHSRRVRVRAGDAQTASADTEVDQLENFEARTWKLRGGTCIEEVSE